MSFSDEIFALGYSQGHNCETNLLGIEEPLALATSFAFLVCAYFVFNLVKTSENGTLKLFPWAIILLGLGSILGTISAAWVNFTADLLPVYIIMFLSVYFVVQKLARNLALPAIITLLLVQLGSFVLLPEAIWGINTQHLLNFSAFILILIWLYGRFGKVAFYFIPVLISYLFVILSVFIDKVFCSLLGAGSHFFWHLLLAVALYYLVVGLKSMNEKVGR